MWGSGWKNGNHRLDHHLWCVIHTHTLSEVAAAEAKQDTMNYSCTTATRVEFASLHTRRDGALSCSSLLDVCAQCRPTSKETFPRYTLFNLQVGITIERGRCVGGIPRRRRYIIIRQSKIPCLLCIESAALSLLTLSLSLERILQQVE